MKCLPIALIPRYACVRRLQVFKDQGERDKIDTSLDRINKMMWQLLIDQAVYRVYRLSTYAMLNLTDDPALLAFVFC